MVSIARSNTMPFTGPSTAMIEIALSGSAAGSVRQTTQSKLPPSRFHPVAEDTHFLRPLMIQSSPSRLAVVRTPSPGGGEPALALPPGSLKQKPASGAPAPRGPRAPPPRGAADPALALPPGALKQKPASGAPLGFRNGTSRRWH